MAEFQELIRAGLAVLLASLAGLSAFPMLGTSRKRRAAAFCFLALIALLAPLLVPLPHTTMRWIVALASITVVVKLYDLHRAVETGPAPGAREFLAYLPNECDLVLRDRRLETRPSRREDASRLSWLIPAAIVASFLIAAAYRVEWRRYPWPAEHGAKVFSVLAFMQSATNIGACCRRLLRLRAADFSGWFFLSATPAEFWRRWNRPAGRFLLEYVYKPAGGFRHPFRAVMVTFAVNGIVHEYVFGIAAGRVLGWALAFFLIQGLATAATQRLRPDGWERAVGIALTLVFNLGCSVFLFACVDAVLPFYASRGGLR